MAKNAPIPQPVFSPPVLQRLETLLLSCKDLAEDIMDDMPTTRADRLRQIAARSLLMDLNAATADVRKALASGSIGTSLTIQPDHDHENALDEDSYNDIELKK